MERDLSSCQTVLSAARTGKESTTRANGVRSVISGEAMTALPDRWSTDAPPLAGASNGWARFPGKCIKVRRGTACAAERNRKLA
jgi:hypothetical protein